MSLIAISAFQDNYIWILIDKYFRCIVVDPGDADPVLEASEKNNWQIEAILLTHHHYDHVAGVPKIRAKFPQIVVYGPTETQDKGTTKIVFEGEYISILRWKFFVLATPGHTLGHICYYSPPYLFCGDTIFSGGCGKLFEGTSFQMYQSLQKINTLPEETLICCAHEYTLENMEFMKSIVPYGYDINDYYHKVKILRDKNQKTLPVTLKNERKVNLFLKINDFSLSKLISQEIDLQQPEDKFAWLRLKKDNFQILHSKR